MQVLADRVRIKAAKPAGLFYGCQTLRQLFPTQIESRTKVEGTAWSAPVVKIEDKPQFVWRGLMLDPARQFISKQGILKYIDLLAYHKLNRLHLHLTDVDGWRIEIKRYPRLTEVGAWADYGDGVKVGGFYTQEDIKEIVTYAAERFVLIVPEIETPSHAGAAMVAYPELNCFGTRNSIARFPIDPLCGSEYCPGNDKVFEFLEGVFAEVAAAFPRTLHPCGRRRGGDALLGRVPEMSGAAEKGWEPARVVHGAREVHGGGQRQANHRLGRRGEGGGLHLLG